MSLTEISDKLITYVFENSLTFDGDKSDMPMDKSLIQEGILDSYGIVDLISFIEGEWKIQITSDDFTIEKMGSINKMSSLISSKISVWKLFIWIACNMNLQHFNVKIKDAATFRSWVIDFNFDVRFW